MSAKFISKEQSKTREQVKKQLAEDKSKDDSSKRVRVRLIPIWLRVVIIAFLTAISLIAGIIIGYAVIGDGKPQDALKKETWTHIVDLVDKKN